MNDHLILRVVGKFLIPYVMLFGLYVQFHGDFGPGGGFQAGAIFACGFVIHTLLFGSRSTEQIVSIGFLRVISALGVLVYAGVGVASLLLGGEILNYNVLAADPITGQHIGIIVVEFGVGLTVASTITLLLMIFAERGLPS